MFLIVALLFGCNEYTSSNHRLERAGLNALEQLLF